MPAINYSPPITRLKARMNPKLRARLQSSLSLSCTDDSTLAGVTYLKKKDTVPVCLEANDEDKGKSVVKGGGGAGHEKEVINQIPGGRSTLDPGASPVAMVPPHLPLSSSNSSSCHENSGESPLPNSPRPAYKRNRKSVAVELKLSQEEVEMQGAPEGAVYQVDILDTSDFQPSSCPEKDVQMVETACHSILWVDQYAAINSLRRLSIYHHSLLMENECRLLSDALSFLCVCVQSLRSSMIRNALLALKDIFTFVPQNALKAQVCALAPLVAVSLQRCTGDKKFICVSVKEALLSGARSGICLDVLHMVLPTVQDKRVDVSANAIQIAEVALASLGVGSKAVHELPHGLKKADLFNAMSYSAQGKSAVGRSAALQILGRLKRALGLKRFEKELRECISESDARTILPMLTGVEKMTASRSSFKHPKATISNRPSIRDHILASKLLHMSMENLAESKSQAQVLHKNES